MLVEGSLGTGKTSFLIDKYLELISNGVKSSEILVLCQNSFLKKRFVEALKSRIDSCFGALNVYTFSGVVYRTILNNWPLFENIIPEGLGDSAVSPDMVGVDITSYLIKRNLEKGDLADYQSALNLLHQLLKRYTIISNNALGDDEILGKSEFLHETFAKDSQKVLKSLKVDMLKYRSFDYLRQMDAFSKLFYEGAISDFDDVKYLLVDDFDEFTYQGYKFVKELSSKCENYISFDRHGGARRGYLCAYPDGYKYFEDEIKNLGSKENLLLANFKGAKNKLKNVEVFASGQNFEMMQDVLSQFDLFFEKGFKSQDISVVIAEENETFSNILKDYFAKNDINFQFLSGTQRLYDDKIVFCILTILCLVHPEWGIKVHDFDVRKLLCEFFEISFLACEDIFYHFKKDGVLPVITGLEGDEGFNYNSLISVIENLKNMKTALSDEIMYIFKDLILPNCTDNDTFDFFNKLLVSLDDFEILYGKIGGEIPYCDWVKQVKSSIVSDNPSDVLELKENAVIIATPQKMVDYEVKTKLQLWLDVKNRNWIKEDTGVLYNSWVYQRDFDCEEYTPELHRQLTLEKTGHLLGKLSLLCDEVKLFVSERNSLGAENQGELLNYIFPSDILAQTKWSIIPRDDQAPVLDYQCGKMAVPAVPGAGKTTIMQALIMKLIDDGVNPHEILVLTYMESAARNFLDRIKISAPVLKEYPYISTIHGLAYKILSDEDNASRIGLNSDFEVCDEARHSMIINRICLDNLPAGENFSDWVDYNRSNISRAKMLMLEPEDIEKYLSKKSDGQMFEFLRVYKAYYKALRQANLIDYDDLLIMAHKLLSKNPDIRAYYQSVFKFVIEDEAQDSSAIQQGLINYVVGGNNNLVRCGDLNQAIMTTFTNADVEGFRQFIKEAHNIEMQSSQRCTKDVYELANSLIGWSLQDENLKESFYDIQMKPVQGANPKSDNAVSFNSFEYEKQELEYVLGEIKNIQKTNPKTSIGILVRNNYLSKNWIDFLEQNDVEVVCRADELKDKKIFKLFFAFLKFLENPFDNKLVVNLAKAFNHCNLSRISSMSLNYIRKMEKSFIKNEEALYTQKKLNDNEVLRFWWDIFYWLDKPRSSLDMFLYEFGKYYFSKSVDMENVNLISSIVKRFTSFYERENEKQPTLKEVVSYLEQLGRSRNAKYFEDDESEFSAVEIMTLHKAKGDEFDVVFIPHLVNRFYNIDVEKISPKKDDVLSLKLDNLAGTKQKNKLQVAKEIAGETLRLIYVAITRAKKNLYFTKVDKGGSQVFDLLQELEGGGSD